MSARVVVPEILDHLPHEDPAARRSRRDLRRINFLMGNERWILRTVRRFPAAAGRGIVEIGAGDGFLTSRLAGVYPHATVAALDLAPRPATLDPRVLWLRGDLFKSPPPAPGGIVIANLFLHHFEQAALAELGRWLEGAAVMVFNEPDRRRLPQILSAVMDPVHNHVTRHDMRVSISAGFRQGELPALLGLDFPSWRIAESSTWRGGRRVLVSRT